jgi:hypothetical protein
MILSARAKKIKRRNSKTMKRRILYVGLFIISLGLGAGLAGRYLNPNFLSAQSVVASQQDKVVSARPAVTTTPSEVPPAQPAPVNWGSETAPLEDAAAIRAVLDEIVKLNRDWRISQTGWMHVQASGFSYPRKDRDKNQEMFSESGKEKTDEWYYLSGGVRGQGFSISKDDKEKELQVAVTREDGLSGNLTLLRKGQKDWAITTVEEKKALPLVENPFAVEVVGDLERYKDTVSVLKAWLEPAKNEKKSATWVLYMEFSFSAHAFYADMNENIVGVSTQSVFDAQTGEYAGGEVRYLSEAGRWIIYDQGEISTEMLAELSKSVEKDLQLYLDELNSYGEK